MIVISSQADSIQRWANDSPEMMGSISANSLVPMILDATAVSFKEHDVLGDSLHSGHSSLQIEWLFDHSLSLIHLNHDTCSNHLPALAQMAWTFSEVSNSSEPLSAGKSAGTNPPGPSKDQNSVDPTLATRSPVCIL